MSDRQTRASPGAKPPEAALEASEADSFLRAAAEISEPTPSAAEGRPSGAGRSDLVAGEVLAKRYRLDRELGRGGMGVVWKATHLVTRRRVAIKFVMGPAHLRADARRRFLREARAASTANHPNVVDVLDVFDLDDGTPVMVMELLSGETLREMLLRERRLSLEATASIVLPVIAAVGTAHALGIVHRDLKPENIFLLSGAEPGANVKVLDFGVAKLIAHDGEASESESITGTGSTLGTPCYMAPEQTTGDKAIDGRADIWALGVIVYECLAGKRPVEGSGIGQVVMKLMTEGIKPLDQVVRGLPGEAAGLVMRMLSRERGDRPEDLREVQTILAQFTQVKPHPFAAPGAFGPSEPEQEVPRREQARAPALDTQAPQSIPNGLRRTPRRSMLVGAVAGGSLLAAFIGWRVSTPARSFSPAKGFVNDAMVISVPRAAMAVTPPPSLDAAPLASAETNGSSAPPATANEAAGVRAALTQPTAKSLARSAALGAPPFKGDGSAPTPRRAASEAASAEPNPLPGGLAEKPPF